MSFPLHHRISLSLFFSWFSVVLLALAVLVSMVFWMQVYREDMEQKHAQLAIDAGRIDAVMGDAFDYTEKYIEFIGKKIVQQNVNDLNYIARFIDGDFISQPQGQSLYLITTFDWVTPDKMLRVSNKTGVLRTPFDMSDRDYLKRTSLHPWTMQLSEPRYGGLSKQWIIPGGMGVTDKQGNFAGSITFGFALDGLTRRISQALGPTDTQYVILTSSGKLVLDSKQDNNAPPSDFSLDLSGTGILEKNAHYLDRPVAYNDIEFSYTKSLNKYPFVILVGYPSNMAAMLFNSTVLSNLAGFSGIGAAALIMLYFLRRRLVRPVVELADAADRISKGLPAVMPQSNLQEIALLAEQLEKVSNYVQNEHRINQEVSHKTQLLEISARELKAANAEAVAAAEAARKSDRAKSEFLANMSHELRTPMNAVIGLTDILLSKEHPPEKRQQYLHVIQTSAGHLMQLINDLLDIAKLESDQASLEHIPFDLLKVVDDVLSIVQVGAKQKNILITLNILSQPPQLMSDPLRLQQILVNLVSNAVKFTEKGSVTIDLDCRENPVTRRWNVTIAVTDTGIGIPPGKLGAIFEKFTQADSSISRTHGGTGLGLSISKMLVEMMHGKISAESTYGKGSRFVIELPMVKAQAATELPAEMAVAAAPEVLPGKAHVLLVEDHQANIMVATALLDICGCSYELAKTGKEALAKIADSAAAFDVVLMDVQMPEMDGFEVTGIIRAREKSESLPRLPIIGITAHALAGDRQRCIDAGMDDYLAKPFNPELLMNILKRFAGKKEASMHQAA